MDTMVDRVTKEAQRIAADAGSEDVTPDHFLAAVFLTRPNIATESVRAVSEVAYQTCLHLVDDARLPTRTSTQDEGDNAQLPEHLLSYAQDESARLGCSFVGIEHVMLALLQSEQLSMRDVLSINGLTAESLREWIRANLHTQPSHDPLMSTALRAERVRIEDFPEALRRNPNIRDIITIHNQMEDEEYQRCLPVALVRRLKPRSTKGLMLLLLDCLIQAAIAPRFERWGYEPLIDWDAWIDPEGN